MDTTPKRAAGDSDRLARDLRALLDDAQALLQHAVRDAGAAYEESSKRLEERVAVVRAQLESFEDAAIGGIKRAGRGADAYVHENPWPAIGASAGVGLLLGLLIGRR